MKLKKKNSLYFALTIAVCAILAVLLSKTNLADKGPEILIVETRYSDPLGKEGLFLRRGGQPLFALSERFDWEGGGEKDEVLTALGSPKYKLEFMDEEYFVWESTARYDWDLRNEQPGRFLTLSFNYSDKVDSVAISWDTPFRAESISAEEFSVEVEDVGTNEGCDLVESSSSAELQD